MTARCVLSHPTRWLPHASSGKFHWMRRIPQSSGGVPARLPSAATGGERTPILAAKLKYAFCGARKSCTCVSSAASANSSFLRTPQPNGRRDHLWDRDVAEAFLQPNPSQLGHYLEFEVSPNGMWIDLDIFPGGRADLESGLERSVMLDESGRTWTAEMAIPMRALEAQFDPRASWRANFYRVEGSKEPRAYLAWQATRTAQPNFHVPRAFGKLRFAGAGGV